MTRLVRAVPPRLRRPAGLVEQTRWLFLMFLLGEMVVVLPVPLRDGVAARVLMALASATLLVSSWLCRYLRRSNAWQLDVVEAVAVLAFGLSSMRPSISIGIVMSSLWLRAMYGGSRRLGIYCVAMASALAGVFPLWSLVWDDPTPAAVYSLGPIPITFLVAIVSRHLALNLMAREQSQGRDAALGLLGTELLAATERADISTLARNCADSLCSSSPGLGIVMAVSDDPATTDSLRVVQTAGSCGTVPGTLPPSLVPSPGMTGAPVPVPDAQRLSADTTAPWLCVPLPEQPGSFLFVTHPQDSHDDALRAVVSMVSQVALALRNSKSHDSLATQAHTDALTGLANRSAFGSALEAALQQADGVARPAVIFLDLDDFKTVNDTMGHACGDELLQLVAGRLLGAVRGGDVCARLGGDEFAVLLHGADDDVATVVAQRLVDVVAAPFVLAGRTATIGASVGLVYVEPESSAEQLVQHADIAMYAAKAKGKNRVQTFYANLLSADSTSFEDDLRGAAASGEIVVHYQPIIDVSDGRCTGVEALARWQHPRRGLLEPADFLAVAERTGAIHTIGDAVLRTACADVRSWEVADDFAVHVNVSGGQLAGRQIVDEVSDCLQHTGLLAHQLVIEIIESMVLDSPAVRATIDELAALGVTIAIDDFGTGYSALTTLRTLPIAIVKIDQSFVAGCASQNADHAVVEAIVQMSARMGLRTIAEGVERVDQHETLRTIGVDAVQGFLHLRPSTATELKDWLAARRPAIPAQTSAVVRHLPRHTA